MTVSELTQPASESELDEFGTPRGALAGIRVLDLSRMMSGPLCGRMLADLGAEVIKVEPPEGDATRGVPPLVGGFSPYYAQLNAGKRTVCLDLKAPGGPDIISRLAAASDVLVENLKTKWKVQRIAPGHCTGEPAFARLKKAYGENYLYAGLGTKIEIRAH